MGLIAEVLEFERVQDEGAELGEVRADGFGGDPRTLVHSSSPGDDSPPLPGDTVIADTIPGSGALAAIGYLDTKNAGTALTGEKRIYGRDVNGAIVSAVHLKRDGSIAMSTGAGSFEMRADGTVIINGLEISPIGEIKTAAGIVLGTHTHAAGFYLGDADVPVAGPVTGTSGEPVPTP